MILRKTLIIGATIIASPFIYILVAGSIYTMLGYPLDATAGELAERIVENNLDPRLCGKLKALFPTMGPTLGEKRANCYYIVAKMKKDPNICEYLMPSSYGWSCLGGAMDFEPCVFLADGNKTIKGQGIVTTFDECLSGPTATRTHVCCQMARITFQDGNTESCTSFDGSDPLSDQCHHEVAIKKNSIDECSLIKNVRNRAGCIVGVRALRK